MSWAIDSPSFQAQAVDAFQLHKSLGLTVLLLSLLRLAWRFLYPPPPLPPQMAPWETALAAVTHWLFYGLMIAMPLSGWLYVSLQWRGDAPFNIPTLWFGLFEVPHLFGLSAADSALREQAAALAFSVHGAMALGLVLLLALHVGAALKHHLVDRDGVLARMLPWLAAPPQPTAAVTSQAATTRTPTVRGMAAAAITLLVALLFIVYATTSRLVPEEASPVTGKARVLQDLVSESGTQAIQSPVDFDNSHILFSGVHAGRDFNGRFGDWQAAIHFDAEAPQESFVAAAVATDSATTGVPLHDRSLPQSEWFDAARHPLATWRSTRIEPLGDDRYAIEGVLSIKGNSVELAPLVLTIDGATLRIEGTVELDRAAVDMGMESDPEGQYVSRSIGIRIEVRATRAPGRRR